MKPKTITASQATQIIHQGDAVVKIVSADPTSSRCLDYFLDQLASPQTKRPVKTLNNHYRHRLFNPKTGLWDYRSVEDDKRGAAKPNKLHTKKTSVTLLPTDGKINFFKPKHGHAIGFIFNLHACDIKNEKYVFASDASTDAKWWLKEKGKSEAQQAASLPRSISITSLKNHLIAERAKGNTPDWNELLVGLNLDGLVGLSITENDIAMRLNALRVQMAIKHKLNIDLPIFLISPTDGILRYSKLLIDDDLKTTFTTAQYNNLEDINDLLLQYIMLNTQNTDLRKSLSLPEIKNDSDHFPLMPFKFEESYPRDLLKCTVNNYHSPIFIAALFGFETLGELALSRQDEYVAVLKWLRNNYSQFSKRSYYYEFGSIRKNVSSSIDNILQSLLVNLHSSPNTQYTMGFHDKRLLEKALIDKVKSIDSPTELKSFWNQHKNSHYLNQHRYGLFDAVFRGKDHMTGIKKSIHDAVQEKGKAVSVGFRL